MTKKLSLAMAVVAVLASAIATTANAGNLTSSPGVVALAGTVVTGTSTNAITETSLGTLVCKKVTVNGMITFDGAGAVEAITSGAGTAPECFIGTTRIAITDATLLTLTSNAAEEIEIEGAKKPGGHIGLTFKADLPGLECHYVGKAVPFNHTSGSSSIRIVGPLVVTPAACGSATFRADFALEIGKTAVSYD